MRIEISASAKNHLAYQSERFGMTQVAFMSQLLEWFASQDEPIQAACLKRYPTELEPDIARLILKRMAAREIA